MSGVDVDLSSDEGITYVELLYGPETDYTAQIIGMGGSLDRADSLGDSVGMF